MADWIVAHCHAKAETKAEAHLKRQGFEVYLPKIKTTLRHARRIQMVLRPLFPRYLFIAFDENSTHWRPICSTVGVSYLLKAGEQPLVAPAGVIEQLRQREDKYGFFSLTRVKQLNKGDPVKFTKGPLTDCSGVFECLSDSQRVAVLLDIMGRQVKTLVPMEAIQQAS
ncbi:MAG: transcriptional activator RfaH [Magnetovibrio sp.]|mgnify:FL=1|nr:transcriptional activator RfaH [Magnetovibrio sp.]|tara:strand:+ start:4869 stop:5372 length:504 start_codon:yes stop_codon:yes gene_type:complete